MTLLIKLICDATCDGRPCIASRSHNVTDLTPIHPLTELRDAGRHGWIADGMRDYCPTCAERKAKK